MEENTIDSFKILLNNISHELDEQNLQSLLSLCSVPGGSRSRMKDGWTFFDYLMKIDYISKDKLGNLRELLKRMRPRRRDLVRLVDDYIKKEYDTDDVSEIIANFSDSWEKHMVNPVGYPDPENHDISPACCKVNCVCYWHFPSCYVPLITFVAVLFVFVCISWFADFPKITNYLNENENRKNLGKYVVGALFLLLVVLSTFYGRKKWSASKQQERSDVSNFTIQNESAARSSSDSLVTSKVRVPISRQKSIPGYGSCSCSCSGQSGVFSDYSTGHTGAGSTST